MRATMMLADYAQIADGKLFISGGGWSTCGPGPTPCAVVAIFHVPWQETDQKVSFALRLIDEDGRAVMQPGTDINVPMSFNIVLHLTPGRRYSWVLDVDGHADDSWQLSFETRQAG
jgi:hypothetical protein